MAIPQKLVDEIMVKCARRCCICRRFDPLHLIIHHIKEQAEGGEDVDDNLIPICLTCHADAHTLTKLSRRFSDGELKGHREKVYALVHEGRLPEATQPMPFTALISDAIAWASGDKSQQVAGLLPEAIELLIEAANVDGNIINIEINGCAAFKVGNNKDVYNGTDHRKVACFQEAMQQLQKIGAIAHTSRILYQVTHHGYQLADYLIAGGAESKLK